MNVLSPSLRAKGPRSRVVGGCGFAFALLLAGAPCFADSLKAAVALAYQTNPELRAQRAELRAIDEEYAQAKAGFGPQIAISGGLSAEAARVAIGAALLGGSDKANFRGGTTTTTFSAVQPLYTSGQLTARLGEAEATVFLNRQTLRQVESRTLLATITAYADVLRDRAALTAIQEEIASLTSEGEESRAKGRAGQITKTDVSQAEARLISARILHQTATARLKVSESGYLRVVGEAPGVLDAESSLPHLPGTIDEAFDAAIANNPELLASAATELVARRRVDAAKSANGPSVALRLDGTVGPTVPYLQHSYEKSVAGSIVYNIPLFAAGMNRSRVRQAVEENNRAALGIEAQRRQVVDTTAGAWTQLVNARLSARLQEQQIEVQQEVVKGNKVEQRVGQRPLFELLNAEVELTSARLNLLQTRRDGVVAEATLLAAMGLLEARMLFPELEGYDPVAPLQRAERRVFAPLEPAIKALERTTARRSGPPPISSADFRAARPAVQEDEVRP